VEVTVKNTSEVSREVDIVAIPEDLRTHFEKAYKDYQKKVEIPGFRKGRVPMDMLKKLYGELIEQDALETIASELFRQAVREKELKPIGEPALTDLQYTRGENLKCTVRYEIRPQIVLKEYKGIPVRKLVHTITKEEIDKELERLQRINSTLEPAAKVDSSDYVVTVDLQDLDESGSSLIGKKTVGARFYLADEQLEQPFKDALAQAQVGMETRIQFEHSHGEHVHAVNTHVRVTNVEHVLLPALDDDFVTRITKERFKTVADLRANMMNDVHEYWKAKADRQVLNELIAEMLKRHEFEVPEALVRSVLDGLKEEMKQEQPGKRLPADFDDARFVEQNRAYAVAQSKWALLREELIAAEKLTVEDTDLEAIAEQESERIKIDKDRLIAFYKTSDQVKDRVLGDKLIKLLVQAASITEAPDTQPA
jgi:trigger factor